MGLEGKKSGAWLTYSCSRRNKEVSWLITESRLLNRENFMTLGRK